MEWTDGDKAIVAEISGRIIEKVLKVHVDTCPYDIIYKKDKALLIGLCLGGGLSGGGLITALIHMLGA
ncbi:hypothetical protein LCGC14_0849500 [marine sediment metagenome]|uniref:Uncharacterized protein n=1 Tax=marine sediment metagenome TaxID=412755 RepID=A0A0F9PW01_9ZZZZ